MFDNFEVFYNWAMTNGYTDGARLSLFDRYGSYSPGNCFWVIPGSGKGTNKKSEPGTYYLDSAWMWKWDDTVNRIRRYYGMEPIHSSEV